MDAYLSKPIHRDELFDIVERYLGVTKAGVFQANRLATS